ncbi:MAG: amidohydrolase [Dehalococcoidia bacterium]
MLIRNARVYPMDGSARVADAVLVRSGHIAAVGSSADVGDPAPGERVVDAGGRTLLPGLIDAHAHLINLARGKLGVIVTGCASPEEVADRVRERAAALPPGNWIIGRGWDQNLWSANAFPTADLLDAVVPAHPIVLTRIDGHASWANRLALRRAGIDAGTPDPAGGRFLRDEHGEPTGILIDTAQRLLREAIPPPAEEAMLQAIRVAIADCVRVGLTQIHEMGVDLATIRLYKRLIDAGEFPFRVYAAVGGRGETWDHYRQTGPEIGYGGDRLSVRALKLVADGALGSRGAALLAPYSDDEANSGLTIIAKEEVFDLCMEAVQAGFQVCTHAIGDRANREVLDAYQQTFATHTLTDHRFRVEHAQILTEADLPRFRRLGVLPSMQATHCTSDMPWATVRLGTERLRYAYAWRSLLDTGVPILGGSDFPVENPNPLLGLYASIARRQPGGVTREGWNPAERMSRQEAVRSFTSWAAYGAFEEGQRGTIAPGYSADLVLLTGDPFTVPEEAIPQILPSMTVVGGEVAYESGEMK